MINRPKGRQPIPENAKKVFSGVLFDVYQWEQKMFDGSTETFEKLKRADTVCVIPVLFNRQLLLVEDEQPGRAKVLTFPGGRVDPGEDPEMAARRELLEETGYECDSLTLYKATQPVSKLDWALFFFIAKGCRKIAEPHPDAGERITERTVSLDQCLTLEEHDRLWSGELMHDFLKARYDPDAREKLENLLFGA